MLASAALAGLGAAALGASPAQSAVPLAQDPQCAAAYPVDMLTRGLAVTGLTVSSGTVPDGFTGEVLGVLQDGIAPGLDMVMVRLTSDEIDRVGGIWAGMSGSPVYAPDGRLIGAVSYGLAYGPSPVAGVTPAEDMQALLDNPPTGSPSALDAANGPEEVAVPDRMSDRIVADGAATQDEVDSGLSRLPLPLGVSGIGTAKRMRQFKEGLGIDDVRVYRAGAVGAGGPAGEIVAGGNIAASISYGDVTSAGVGTATQVCGDEVVAFGHPMTWTGPTTLTMHSADAIYVQEDPAWAPFKVANLTGAAGTISDDRMAGISGHLGVLPDTTEVSAHVTTSEGNGHDGTTMISLESEVPYLSAWHLLVDQDRAFDGVGQGSARVRWTVEGVRADGSPFEFSRVDRYASSYDITFETIWDSWDDLDRVLNNTFEDVRVTDVSYRAYLDREYRRYNVTGLKRAVGDHWVAVSKGERLRVQPGQRLRLQVKLTSKALGTKLVPMTVRVPTGTAGREGSLRVSGGSSVWAGGGGAGSFEQLLTKIENAVHNNDLVTSLRIFKRGADATRSVRATLSDVVGGSFWMDLKVRR
jgi:hypothetical protein